VFFGAVVLLVTAAAHAEPCELAIELRGAVADATLRRPVEPSADAQVVDLALPPGARLVGVTLGAPSVPVSRTFDSQLVTDREVVGADPVLAMQPNDGEARVIIQPTTRKQLLVARWTTTADIIDGELELVLPAHAADGCHGSLRASPGPGAAIKRVRVDGTATRGASASFEVPDRQLTLAAELQFARPEPIAWVQDEAMGDGFVARALTVIAPRATPHAKRVLLVIDHSTSMKIVGTNVVSKLVAGIGAALPAGTEIEAIAFDRAPARLLGAWKPADATALATIDAALAKRPLANGTDLATAFALAHEALAEGKREPALVVAITDGMVGDVDAGVLAQKLGEPRAVDLAAVVIVPRFLDGPSRAALAATVDHLGGSYTEIDANDLDPFAHHPGLLAPGWRVSDGNEVHSGEGYVAFSLAKAMKPAAITVHDETTKVALAATAAPATPLVGQLALAHDSEPHSALFARHGFADATHDLAVLATTGRVAANRHAMVAGGGPYTRMIEVEDPENAFIVALGPAPKARRPTVLDRDMLQKLFELQLQPAAFRCFQHELGRNPSLAGTVQFGIELGRGEVTHVALAGTGDTKFDQCLIDAAYTLAPPLVDPKIDPDDRTIANYPLTFSVRAEKPIVVSGDADSSSPLDIDAIKGGVPERVRLQDTKTPLGPLKP